MSNDVLTEALKEAYSSVPSGAVLLDTIEIRHPAILPIRVVLNKENISARLEDTAPANPGEIVEFLAFSFKLTLPSVDDQTIPSVVLTIDNVDRTIINAIESIVTSNELIQFTYRPYLSNILLDGPQYDPPLHLNLTEISVNAFQVSGKGTFPNLKNLSFPSELYTAKRFPRIAPMVNL